MNITQDCSRYEALDITDHVDENLDDENGRRIENYLLKAAGIV